MLAAAHEGTGVDFIRTGSNYAFNQGQRVNVSNVVQYPGYTGSFNDSVDLEIIHLANDVVNPDGTPIVPLTIAAVPAAHTVLSQSGFGRHGVYSDSSWSLDGNLRAWNTPVSSTRAFFPGDFVTEFGTLVNGVVDQGNAYLLDSGAPGFAMLPNPDGIGNSQYLVGMLVGGTQPPDSNMVGISVNLDNYRDWIYANDLASVPEPLFAPVFGLGAAALFLRRRQS